jgi:hypothetical protein
MSVISRRVIEFMNYNPISSEYFEIGH